jgi:hypothetical protein
MVSQFKRIAGDKYAKKPTNITPPSKAPSPRRTMSVALRERGNLNDAPDT